MFINKIKQYKYKKDSNMGLFNIFKNNKKSEILENTVMGYMRMEISNLLNIDMRSNDFNKASLLATQLFKADLISKIDKKKLQDMTATFSTISKNRVDELFGTYIILISVQHTIMAKSIEKQKITPNSLVDNLHKKIKALINQVKSN